MGRCLEVRTGTPVKASQAFTPHLSRGGTTVFRRRAAPRRQEKLACRSRRAEVSFQLGAEISRSLRETGNVIADMNYGRRARRNGEESVEIRHAKSLGGWHIEAETRVVESTRGDPAKPRLNGVQNGEQQMPGRPGFVAAKGCPAISADLPFCARPT